MKGMMRWLTDLAVGVRILAVVMGALAGALTDAAVFDGQLGDSLLRALSSSSSEALPASLHPRSRLV